MKKRWWIIAAIALMGLVIGAVVLSQREPVPAVQLNPQNVVTTITVTGEVRADNAVAFSPPVNAKIIDVTVDEGDTIQTGQILVRLETEQLQAQIAEAEARAAQAEAAYANVAQGTRPEQIRLWEERYRESAQRVSQAQTAVRSAELRVQDTTRTAQRFNELLREELISRQEYDVAKTQQDIAVQDAARARADLVAVRGQRVQIATQLEEARRGPTQPEIRQAAEAVRVAQANIQTLRRQIASDYRMVSPMSGIIIERLQDPGDLARPDQPILRAINPNTLEVVASVEENDLSKIRAGDSAYVVLDALPETPLEARIKRIGSQVNPENGTVEARVLLNNSAWPKLQGTPLLPGMTADVNVVTGRLSNALILPASAVRREGSQWVVYRFDGSRIKKQAVQGDRVSVENFRVTGGLEAGDWVAQTASDALLAKKKVRPEATNDSQNTEKSKSRNGITAR